MFGHVWLGTVYKAIRAGGTPAARRGEIGPVSLALARSAYILLRMKSIHGGRMADPPYPDCIIALLL